MSLFVNPSNGSNNIFSSMFGGSSSTSQTNGAFDSSLLSDYASIKNGSYAKLTKAYYGNNSRSDKTAISEENAELKKEYSKTKSSASDLKDAISSLVDSKSLFEKTKVADEDGNETMDYNREKIGESVKTFVDKYNAMIKDGGDSSNNAVLRSTLSMVKRTSVNENLLKNVGITIKSDNTLSLDEESLKSANISDLKSLFSGSGSYADNIASAASSVFNSSVDKISGLSGYSASGSYTAADTAGSIYDGTY